MGIEDILAEFDNEKRTGTESPGWKNLFDELCQEAIRIGMELNNQYHTPEELREIMGRLTGKKVDDTFRMFPPFYTDFGKISQSEKMYSSIPDVTFRIRAELKSGTAH